MRKGILAIAVAAACFSGPVLAWGRDGHRIVAQIAFDHLTPQAQATITAELKAAGEPEPTLPGIANWADEVRDKNTQSLHYVNMPPGDCHYVAARDCPGGKCVVGAIEASVAVLKNVDSPESQRIIALKNLVHFVGDINQPLHAGMPESEGGNKIQLQWSDKGSNLHSLWDSGLIRTIDPDWQDYEKKLSGRSVVADWSTFAPAGWAEASCLITERPDFRPTSAKPGMDYLQHWQQVLEDQLTIAGLRLAAILNQIY